MTFIDCAIKKIDEYDDNKEDDVNQLFKLKDKVMGCNPRSMLYRLNNRIDDVCEKKQIIPRIKIPDVNRMSNYYKRKYNIPPESYFKEKDYFLTAKENVKPFIVFIKNLIHAINKKLQKYAKEDEELQEEFNTIVSDIVKPCVLFCEGFDMSSDTDHVHMVFVHK